MQKVVGKQVSHLLYLIDLILLPLKTAFSPFSIPASLLLHLDGVDEVMLGFFRFVFVLDELRELY